MNITNTLDIDSTTTIFSFFPPKELLTIRQTNKEWNTVIQKIFTDKVYETFSEKDWQDFLVPYTFSYRIQKGEMNKELKLIKKDMGNILQTESGEILFTNNERIRFKLSETGQIIRATEEYTFKSDIITLDSGERRKVGYHYEVHTFNPIRYQDLFNADNNEIIISFKSFCEHDNRSIYLFKDNELNVHSLLDGSLTGTYVFDFPVNNFQVLNNKLLIHTKETSKLLEFSVTYEPSFAVKPTGEWKLSQIDRVGFSKFSLNPLKNQYFAPHARLNTLFDQNHKEITRRIGQIKKIHLHNDQVYLLSERLKFVWDTEVPYYMRVFENFRIETKYDLYSIPLQHLKDIPATPARPEWSDDERLNFGLNKLWKFSWLNETYEWVKITSYNPGFMQVMATTIKIVGLVLAWPFMLIAETYNLICLFNLLNRGSLEDISEAFKIDKPELSNEQKTILQTKGLLQTCSLSGETILRPARLKDDNDMTRLYDADELEKHILENGTHPFTGEKCSILDIVPDDEMRFEIEAALWV